MALGLNTVLKRESTSVGCKSEGKSGIGSRRIFAPHFKLQVLDSYRNDSDCKGNQRATARKYGIHRRQIQKWLQCENNLRNSVAKGKTSEQPNTEITKCDSDTALKCGAHRQQDDSNTEAYSQNISYSNSRVPTASPVAYNEPTWAECGNQGAHVASSAPLDYTVRSQTRNSQNVASPVFESCDSSTPMDLSVKRFLPTAEGDIDAPVCCPLSPRLVHDVSPSPPSFIPLAQSNSDVWDLSTKTALKRKHADSYPVTHFLHSPNSQPSLSPDSENQIKPVKLFKPYLDDLEDEQKVQSEISSKTYSGVLLPCCSQYSGPLLEIESPFYNNNNIHVTTEYTYTLHELQPKSCVNYFYPGEKNYICPIPECDSSYCTQYETNCVIQPNITSLKQRQSYSLDFKLSAIESYYQDSTCRGNQRAVANKYNIHRRQVQKWLQQEDELRQRNETTKQIHAVR